MGHHQYLLQALQLAQERRGFCSPNPSVGALVVKGNTVIATGRHYAAGHAHAEVMACQNLPADLDHNVSLYVTLEPCCHWGRTPPCTDLILQKGIKNVFYGYRDPNPVVSGQGELFLQQHGIDCRQIALPEINSFYQSYTHWVTTHQPWVTCKLAISLDSKIADAVGRPVMITGEEAQKLTHQSRCRADAILTSAKTIIQDNPLLNVRFNDTILAKSLYILDSELSLPLNAKVFQTAAKITVFYSQIDKHKLVALHERGVECRLISHHEGLLSLPDILNNIGAEGIHDLWVEAGGTVFSAFIRARLAQKSIIYVAPKLLGVAAYPAFSEEYDFLSHAKKVSWHSKGQDAICEIDWT